MGGTDLRQAGGCIRLVNVGVSAAIRLFPDAKGGGGGRVPGNVTDRPFSQEAQERLISAPRPAGGEFSFSPEYVV